MHQTVIGGFFSVLVKTFIFTYAVVLLDRLWNNKRDANTTMIGALNLDESNNYKETKATVFHVLRKLKVGATPIGDEKELGKYFKSSFQY